MVDYHVKNSGHLTKAFKVRGGHTTVAAGRSADVVDARELTEAQIEALAKDGVKVTAKADKAKADEKPADEPKTAAEVLAMATAEGVHFQTFAAEARKLLGDKTPSSKDDIVKALEELATAP